MKIYGVSVTSVSVPSIVRIRDFLLDKDPDGRYPSAGIAAKRLGALRAAVEGDPTSR